MSELEDALAREREYLARVMRDEVDVPQHAHPFETPEEVATMLAIDLINRWAEEAEGEQK